MNLTHTPFLHLFLPLVASGALAAQEAPTTVLPQLLHASPIRAEAAGPDGVSGGLWAAGRDYKVSFHDGMAFHPRVGPTLPHQPLRWRTVSVRAGEHELLPPAAAAAAATAPRHSDFRCEYDLGAVTERYDVRDDGVEQSFVVHRRPPAGDLVVTGVITTPLQLPATGPRHGAVTLTLADGRPVVDYGAAVAIDADGVRTPLATAVDGDRVVLRVAAETVAQAAFPLVIDPLLSTSTLLGFGTTVEDLDVLHETRTAANVLGRAWYAWTTAFAAGDRDLRLWRCGADFDGTVVEQYREITDRDCTHGRLALAPAADRVILVHATEDASHSWITLHSHHVLDFGLTTSAVIVPHDFFTESDWRPDIGGRLEPNGTKVLITFQREVAQPLANTANSTVYATVFDAAAFPQSSAFVVLPFVVLPRPNADQERPAVNQAASGNEWLLAFQEVNNNVANDDWDVVTVAVDGNGVALPTGLDTESAADLTVHTITPQVSGTFGRYLLTYTTRAFEQTNPLPSGRTGSSVFAQRLDFDHATGSGSLPHAAVPLLSVPQNVLRNGGSAFDSVSRSHWCTGTFHDGLGRLRIHKLGYTGSTVESQLVTVQNGYAAESMATTFRADARRFPIVWSEHDAANDLSVLYGTSMDYVAAPAPTLLGFACGSGVWNGVAELADRQQVGSENLALRLTNAPEDSIAFVMVATSAIHVPGDLFGAPGCTIVPDLGPTLITILPTVIQNGDATVRVDLPEYAGPTTLYLQWGYFVTGANPLGIQASEGLEIVSDR